jgi:hypothetical protein
MDPATKVGGDGAETAKALVCNAEPVTSLREMGFEPKD